MTLVPLFLNGCADGPKTIAPKKATSRPYVLEPEAGVMAIGSGGNYALAAARALVDSDKDAETIVRRALDIAADICVYTNRNVTIEALGG